MDNRKFGVFELEDDEKMEDIFIENGYQPPKINKEALKKEKELLMKRYLEIEKILNE